MTNQVRKGKNLLVLTTSNNAQSMDQDAFRSLLATSRPKQAAQNNITRRVASSASSEPAFKPRKVKNVESKYRDRASERRGGVGNDYAQVEAVFEDFRKRVANEDKDVVEEQRKYLGGDGQHTVLVKGLDMSLLEQNRARAATATEDDEILEQAFVESTSTNTTAVPKKRTREDIIRALKEKRQNGDKSSDEPVAKKSVETEGSTFEAAKAAGKFRPIGFKPVGRAEDKPKKRKVKAEKEAVKKKVESTPVHDRPAEEAPKIMRDRDTTEAMSPKLLKKPPEPEPAPLDENFDIFAGAGDYEAFAGNEESDEERDAEAVQEPIPSVPAVGARGWFNEPESEVRAATPLEKSPPALETEEELRHLQPLESSALPSIRDFLAMDEAVEKAEKRKARKEKKKKKKGGDDDED